MPRYTYGPKVKTRVKRLVEALLDFVNGEFDDTFDIEFKWEAEDSANPKLIVRTTLVVLGLLTAKDKYSGKLTKPQLQEALNLLKDFLKILEDNRTKTQGVDTWHFTLTLWSKDKEKNLKQFEQAWERSRPEKSKALEPNFNKSGVSAEASQNDLDWQDCCRKMLPTGLSTNPLLSGDGVMLNIEDIVPLELLERKQRPQLQEDFSPEHFQVEASSESEVPVSHKQFFEQVLAKGNSDKSQGRKIAIIGEPGAGKSTFLQKIAHWIYPERGLPIFVRLADLQEKSLEEYLLNDWLKNATGKRCISDDIQDDFVEQFNADRVWLLLDGVDEMGVSGNLLSSIDKHLKGWVDKARIVLTCRLNVWDADKNALYGFDTYRTKQLSYPEMVREFICSFFSKFGEVTKGEKLIEKLEQSPQRIRDLIKNPLRLTLLCRTWKRRQGKLPQTKAELYKGFVETFYDWKDNLEILPEKRQLLNRALGELAKRAIDAENTKFRLPETFLRQELDKFDKCLFGLACDLGWINKVGVAAENPDEPVYAFFHPTFQEYFAALAIYGWDFFLPCEHKDRPVKDKDNPGKYKAYRIFEPQWKEVILLWLGRDKDEVPDKHKEEFIKALVEFDDGCGEFYKYRAYFLAAAGIGEFENSVYGDEVVEQLIKWKFNATRERTLIAKEAEVALLQTHHQKVVDALTMMLESCVGHLISLNIAITLIQKAPGNSIAVKIIVDYLQKKNQHFLIRAKAITNLKEFGASNPIAIAALAKESPKKQKNTQSDLSDYLRSWFKLPTGNPNDLESLLQLVAKINMEMLDKAIARLNDINILVGLLRKRLTLQTEIENLGNLKEVIELIDKVDNSNSHFVNNFISCVQISVRNRLIEIASSSCLAVSKLFELMQNANLDRHIFQEITWVLGEAASKSSEATKVIIQLLLTIEDGLFVKEFIYPFVNKILKSDILEIVVKSLKDYIEKIEVYEVLWHCAQNMTYPAFYQAWHQQEGEANTNTPSSQTLNPADLPQSLQSAIANNPHLSQTIHLICIDTSKFINPDNPAAEIYIEMVEQGCPERPSGEPTTMQALKVYWKLLKTDKRVVLVFYEGSTDATLGKGTAVLCPYSDRFLKDLSKFDGAISVISDETKDDIPVKFFTSSQAIQDFVQWLRDI